MTSYIKHFLNLTLVYQLCIRFAYDIINLEIRNVYKLIPVSYSGTYFIKLQAFTLKVKTIEVT